jgi:multicomponent Na+:H+ antiporter subunit E
VVVVASLLSLRLLPAAHWKWRLGGAVRFLAFFVVESVRGGWDVAWRALAPRPRLAPGLLTYAPRLPAGAARWLFCNAVSLLPGTAVVAIEPERLTVHALAAGPEALRELQRLEERVAGLFGLGDRAAREAKPG